MLTPSPSSSGSLWKSPAADYLTAEVPLSSPFRRRYDRMQSSGAQTFREWES